MNLVEVAVAAPLFHTLTYRLPSGEQNTGDPAPEVFTGRQVLVPLGRRLVTGYILAPAEKREVSYRIKEIGRFISDHPVFPAEMVPFFRWVAGYYQYPIGEVITTALPAGLKKRTGKRLKITGDRQAVLGGLQLSETEIPAWLDDIISQKQVSQSQSQKILARADSAEIVEVLKKCGVIEIAEEVKYSATREKRETCYAKRIDFPNPFTDTSPEDVGDYRLELIQHTGEDLKISEAKALHFFSILSDRFKGVVPRREILREYKNAAGALHTLCERGLLEKIEQRIYRNPLGEVPTAPSAPKTLSAEQQNAVKTIITGLEKEAFCVHLLHGVTGSGKTEVYLRSAEKALAMGKGVLVLVPEIALATQLEAHFLSRFGKVVALLHSGLGAGERYDQWSLVAQGRARIVIGARSAVFAPLVNTGLIVVDEEHDGGYKQDDSLRYNGRDLAVVRGKLQNATVVLGSATPSITSYHNAMTGKYNLLTMAGRVGGVLPEVEIVDIGKRTRAPREGLFAPQFLEQIRAARERNEQSLVLINRRGFSASYICQECGTAVQCEHCNVALTYHKKRSRLVCHYCGFSLSSKLICSNCHLEKLVPMGVGTERVEEELTSHFPEARIARLDSDTATDRKRFLELLKAMRSRQIDILIGTQMIAKGHHFPYVTFVGVVWADGGLSMPDFRAAERTYQLLSQVTGRAGRGDAEGRVIIQTMRPDHYAIDLARNHRFEQFYEREIEIRRNPVFPPFTRLACYRIDGVDEYDVRKTAEKLASFCRTYAAKEVLPMEVLGPASSPLEKIRDRFRWQILIKAPLAEHFRILGTAVAEKKSRITSGKVRIIFDIDPENMM